MSELCGDPDDLDWCCCECRKCNWCLDQDEEDEG